MQRTESKSIQVHPNDEQDMISIMQEFHWNLKSSQEIKLRSQEITGVTSTSINTRIHSEHYIKLVFERLYDFPNRNRLVELENEFFSLRNPSASSYKTPVIIAAIALMLITKIPAVSILIIAAMGFWIYSIITKNKKAGEKAVINNRRRKEILVEVTDLS